MIENIKKGFTLIELLAVILILGIIALIAIPTVNKVLKESKMGALNTTAVTLGNKAEEACQLENLKGEDTTSLYTIVEGELDKPLEIKGDLPREGYILVNDKCEVAYSFYDENNVVSKNFNETKALVNNKETAPSYGLEWKNNINTLDDDYTRTLDASDINNDSVNVQVGDEKKINVFDNLDIYKDILPYTDSFGNEFMLIPKFYISKTKETTDTEVIWNYAVSKHKLDDTYYLPSNFVDEGKDNNQHIELPYVLVGKYEAGSNGASGNDEMHVSKSGLMPRVGMSLNEARSLSTKYNNIEGVSGYQQYDFHIHDSITVLFAIEYATMDSQSIMRGYVDNTEEDGAISTGGSDAIEMSSGTILNDGQHSFNYRGIENLWGNVWSYTEGLLIDQTDLNLGSIYTANNSRYYSSNPINEYYIKLEGYNKLNNIGYTIESEFDKKTPFVNLPIKLQVENVKGTCDFYYQTNTVGYKLPLTGGYWIDENRAGLNRYALIWPSDYIATHIGTRILKTPLQ